MRVPPASLPASGSVRPKPPERAPGAEVGQPRLLLGLGAEAVDRVGPEPHAGLEGDGHRVVDPGQLLDGDAQHREVAAAAAVLLGEGDAEQPEVAHAAHDVDREVVIAVPRLGVRRDLGLGEVTHDRAQRVVLLGELHVHGWGGLPGGMERVTAGTRCDRTLPAMPRPVAADVPLAVVGGRLATDLVDLTDDLAALESAGFWAVVLPFEGAPICARFAHVRPARPWPGPPWRGPAARRVDQLALARTSSRPACDRSGRRSRPATCTR